jgi:hypothetical protein
MEFTLPPIDSSWEKLKEDYLPLIMNNTPPPENLSELYWWILKTGSIIYEIRRQNLKQKLSKNLCFLCLGRENCLVDGHIISSAILKRMGFSTGVNSEKVSISTPESQFWQEKMFCQGCDGTLIGNDIENQICLQNILEELLGLEEEPEVEAKRIQFKWEPKGKILYLYATSLALRVIHHQLAREIERSPSCYDRIVQTISQMRSILQSRSLSGEQLFWVFYNVTSKYAQRSPYVLHSFNNGGMMSVPFSLFTGDPLRYLLLCIVRIHRITIVVALNPPLEFPHVLNVFHQVFSGFTFWNPNEKNSITKSRDFPEYFADHLCHDIEYDELHDWQQRNARQRWKEIWQSCTTIRSFLGEGYAFHQNNEDERLSWPEDVELIERQPLPARDDFNYIFKLPSGQRKYVIIRFQPCQPSSIFVIDRDQCPIQYLQYFEWTKDL